MKLVLQHPHRREDISGVVTSIEEMLPELASRKGVEVRVLSTKDSGMWQQLAAVWWADALLLNSNCLVMTIVARVLRRRTLLKLHYIQYHSVHANYVRMSFRERIVAELRYFRASKSGWLYRAESVGRLVLRTVSALLVHRVCACSSFCAEQASLPRDVRVMRNPMRIPAGQRERELTCLERPRRFVFIGRVTYDKGYDTVVDAARAIAKSGRDLRVDVIGEGPDLAAMKKQVAEHGLTAQFRFFGRLDSIHALAAMSGALAAIMPSRSQETAGYIPVEAASRRVVCLVSTVGGLAETAGPDCPTFTAGRADELAQLMIRYLDDPGAALAAGYSAYRRAQELYSPRLIVDELLALLAAKKSPQKDPDVRGDLNAAQRDAQPEHR